MPVATTPKESKDRKTAISPKGTRVTFAVDVSHYMKVEYVQNLKQAWPVINDCLGEEDQIALSTFGVTYNAVFSYVNASNAKWDGKENSFQLISKEVEDQARGYELALYDAIIKVVKDCPRSLKYKKYRPEIIVFTIGAETSSKATLEELKTILASPKLAGLHVTIIDASDNANAELEEICKPLEHCSFYGCRYDKAGIRQAFEDAQKPFKERVRSAAQIGGGAGNMNLNEDAKPMKKVAKGGKALKGKSTDGEIVEA